MNTVLLIYISYTYIFFRTKKLSFVYLPLRSRTAVFSAGLRQQLGAGGGGDRLRAQQAPLLQHTGQRWGKKGQPWLGMTCVIKRRGVFTMINKDNQLFFRFFYFGVNSTRKQKIGYSVYVKSEQYNHGEISARDKTDTSVLRMCNALHTTVCLSVLPTF